MLTNFKTVKFPRHHPVKTQHKLRVKSWRFQQNPGNATRCQMPNQSVG